jgi:alpha-beta hydrolase superfamily lysophospholipase
MVIKNEQYFVSADKVTNVHYVEYIPEGAPVASLIVAHGIGEHAGRYEELAEMLTKKNIVMYAIDFIGHGHSTSEKKAPMYFGVEGWDFLVRDLIRLNQMVNTNHPEIPCYMLGFSMGSFVVRSVMADYPNKVKVDGVILAGTGTIAAPVAGMVKMLVASEAKKCGGADKVSDKVNELAFGNYNKYFKPCRTEFDWLCKNEEGVQQYIEDPLASKFITPGMFSDLLGAMAHTGKKEAIKNSKKVPILFMSGKEDPVGSFAKSVLKLASEFEKAGFNVTVSIYDDTRHDVFHDNKKVAAMENVCRWIERVMEKVKK